jgi:hypothetical protein
MHQSPDLPRQLPHANGNRSVQPQTLLTMTTEPCPQLRDSHCRIASELAGIDVATTPGHCDFCTRNLTPPRAVNQLTVSLAAHAVKDDPARVQSLLAQHADLLRIQRRGPGTELKRLLAWFASPSDSCECESRAAQMDAWGPDGCREHLNEIVGWLLEEAELRGLPHGTLPQLAAQLLVLRAIRRSEKQSPTKDVT